MRKPKIQMASVFLNVPVNCEVQCLELSSASMYYLLVRNCCLFWHDYCYRKSQEVFINETPSTQEKKWLGLKV